MTYATGAIVTWIMCPCGHTACVPHIEGLASEIVPRLRCRACGAKGRCEIRSGWKSDANALDGAGREKDEGPEC